MSIENRLSKSALPIQTDNSFVATFNVPTVGLYDYSSVAANQNQIVLPLDGKYVYMIERLSFSTTISEQNYLESINVRPQYVLKYENTPGFLYPQPFPLLTYKNGMELNFYFWTAQENDTLLIDFTGILNQIAATVGIASITAAISMVIYEEQDNETVKAIKGSENKSVTYFNK